MELDADVILLDAIQCGLRDGIAKKMDGYNAPLGKVVDAAISENATKIQSLLSGAISGLLEDKEFREHIQQNARSKLAKIIVQRFGGELERQVNALKSDPSTRARITLAIEEIIAST